MFTEILPHDHVAEVQQLAHPASPVRPRAVQERVLTRRGWRSLRYLQEIVKTCQSVGADPVVAFETLGFI